MEKLKLFFSQVFEFMLPFCLQFLSEVGRAVLAAALSACARAEETDLKGAEKARMAYGLIIETMRADAPDLAMKATASMINGAIEVAVKRIDAGRKAGFSTARAVSGSL